jgi:hypothetical protein
VEQERTFERSRRALERVAEDPDQDRPGRELGKHVAQSLGACERLVLESALLEARSGGEVVIGSQRDDEDVRALVAV